MKLKEIYEIAIREGVKADLRGKRQIQKHLLGQKKAYRKTGLSRRRFFDKESLYNPYADTRILCGDPDREIKRILVGIDIGVGELLLADRLGSDKKCDLVLAHHPQGVALAGLPEVMHLQADLLKDIGVAERVATDLMDKRIKEVARRIHSDNHTRVQDAARLLNLPLMCCHTPADNHVVHFLQRLVDAQKPKTLQHLIDLLLKEPEYRDAAFCKAGPQILVGKPSDRPGRVFVDMTGGMEGSKEIFGRMSQLGIQTILGMHLSEPHFEKVKDEYMHVVIAGHIASDNLGMNLLLDKIEKKGRVEILECSGFRRFRR